jgi:hypothetical protein
MLWLTIVFVGLKVAEVIDWSWWWVFSPLWLPPAVVIGGFLMVLCVLIIGLIVLGIGNAIYNAWTKPRRKSKQ